MLDPHDHHVYPPSDPRTYADLTAALIRGDVRTGAARPPADGVRFVQDLPGQDRWLTPGMLNDEGKGDCSTIPRASAPFTSASHVGVLQTAEGLHAFLWAGGLAPGVRVEGGRFVGRLPDLSSVIDRCVALGMNNRVMLPLAAYQGAWFSPIWIDGVAPPVIEREASAARAAMEYAQGEQGAGRRHDPTTEAGQLVASVARQARDLVGAGVMDAKQIVGLLGSALRSIAGTSTEPARVQAAEGLTTVLDAGATSARDMLGEIAGSLASGPSSTGDVAHDVLATAVSEIHQAVPGVLPGHVTDLIGTNASPDDNSAGQPAATIAALVQDTGGPTMGIIAQLITLGADNAAELAAELEDAGEETVRKLAAIASPEELARLAELYTRGTAEAGTVEASDMAGPSNPVAQFTELAQGDPAQAVGAFIQRGQANPGALFQQFQRASSEQPEVFAAFMQALRGLDPAAVSPLTQLLRQGQAAPTPNPLARVASAIGSILGGGDMGAGRVDWRGGTGGGGRAGWDAAAASHTFVFHVGNTTGQVPLGSSKDHLRTAIAAITPAGYSVDDALDILWPELVAAHTAGSQAAPARFMGRGAVDVRPSRSAERPSRPTYTRPPLESAAGYRPASGSRRWWASRRRDWAPPTPRMGNWSGGWGRDDERRRDPRAILALLEQQQGDPITIVRQYKDDGGDMMQLIQMIQQQQGVSEDDLAQFLQAFSDDNGDEQGETSTGDPYLDQLAELQADDAGPSVVPELDLGWARSNAQPTGPLDLFEYLDPVSNAGDLLDLRGGPRSNATCAICRT